MDIPYLVIYSKRKTITIIVERDRKVVVRAPFNTSDEVIGREIQKRSRLLQDKIDHNQKYPVEETTKEFVSGESLMYLGKNYKLYVVDEPLEGVKFDSKFFISKENQGRANQLFREWYQRAAERIIIPKVSPPSGRPKPRPDARQPADWAAVAGAPITGWTGAAR